MPAWLPDDWLVVVLLISAGHGFAEIWARNCEYRHNHRPRRYVKALMTILVTSSLLVFVEWLADVPIKQAIRFGIPWGCASPLVWLVIQEVVRMKSPELAQRLGCDRRARSDGNQRRRELFEDTAKMQAVKRDDS